VKSTDEAGRTTKGDYVKPPPTKAERIARAHVDDKLDALITADEMANETTARKEDGNDPSHPCTALDDAEES
jgi:hypothetical protein